MESLEPPLTTALTSGTHPHVTEFSDEILGSYFYHYLRKLDVYRNQFYMQLWNLNPKGLTKYCPR